MGVYSIAIILIVILILFFALIAILYSNDSSKRIWVPQIKAKLNELSKSINDQDIQKQKYTLVEADKLLDHVLKNLGAKGETMGERLKYSKKWFDRDTYNNVWEAHKARNTLVHEVTSTISSSEIRSYFTNLDRGIRKLLN